MKNVAAVTEVTRDESQQEAGFQIMTKKFLKLYRTKKLMFYTVILPTFLSTLYYGFIASDIYISESQFLVRSSKKEQANPLGLILGPSFSNALNDSYSVNAYILSRDALKALHDDINVQEIYSNSDIDIFSRYGVNPLRRSGEALHEYYKKHVTTFLDSLSGITTLSVRAYSADEAFKINELLLIDAEKHVNKLNERARHDMIKFAELDLEIAQNAAKKATQALTAYRTNKDIIFDPAYFEQLTAEKMITLEQLKQRHAALIAASDDARRQFLYLDRIAQPHHPDYPLEPRRLRMILTTLVLGLIIWGISSMLISGVKEHHD